MSRDDCSDKSNAGQTPREYVEECEAVIQHLSGLLHDVRYDRNDWRKRVEDFSNHGVPACAVSSTAIAPTHNDLLTLLDELEGIQAGYETASGETAKRLDAERLECRTKIRALFSAAQDATYPTSAVSATRRSIVEQIIRDLDAEGRASVVAAWGKQDGEPTIRLWLERWLQHNDIEHADQEKPT